MRYAYCAPKVDYASVRSTVGVAFAAKASEMSARILRMVAFLWGEAGVMGEQWYPHKRTDRYKATAVIQQLTKKAEAGSPHEALDNVLTVAQLKGRPFCDIMKLMRKSGRDSRSLAVVH